MSYNQNISDLSSMFPIKKNNKYQTMADIYKPIVSDASLIGDPALYGGTMGTALSRLLDLYNTENSVFTANAPKADAPKADAPKVDAPKVDAPKVDAPKVDAPKVDAPEADDAAAKAKAKAEAEAKAKKLADLKAQAAKLGIEVASTDTIESLTSKIQAKQNESPKTEYDRLKSEYEAAQKKLDDFRRPYLATKPVAFAVSERIGALQSEVDAKKDAFKKYAMANPQDGTIYDEYVDRCNKTRGSLFGVNIYRSARNTVSQIEDGSIEKIWNKSVSEKQTRVAELESEIETWTKDPSKAPGVTTGIIFKSTETNPALVKGTADTAIEKNKKEIENLNKEIAETQAKLQRLY